MKNLKDKSFYLEFLLLLKILSVISIILAFLFIVFNPNESYVIFISILIGSISFVSYRWSSNRLKQRKITDTLNKIQKYPFAYFTFWITWLASAILVLLGIFLFIGILAFAQGHPDELMYIPLVIVALGFFLFIWSRKKLKSK